MTALILSGEIEATLRQDIMTFESLKPLYSVCKLLIYKRLVALTGIEPVFKP